MKKKIFIIFSIISILFISTINGLPLKAQTIDDQIDYDIYITRNENDILYFMFNSNYVDYAPNGINNINTISYSNITIYKDSALIDTLPASSLHKFDMLKIINYDDITLTMTAYIINTNIIHDNERLYSLNEFNDLNIIDTVLMQHISEVNGYFRYKIIASIDPTQIGIMVDYWPNTDSGLANSQIGDILIYNNSISLFPFSPGGSIPELDWEYTRGFTAGKKFGIEELQPIIDNLNNALAKMEKDNLHYKDLLTLRENLIDQLEQEKIDEYNRGKIDGYALAGDYNKGRTDALKDVDALSMVIPTTLGSVWLVVSDFLSFSVFGFSLWGFLVSIATIGLVLIILKVIRG